MAPVFITEYRGGNIIVEGQDDNTIRLSQDMKGFTGWWFYWNFAIEQAGGMELEFSFKDEVVGPCGPAVSRDRINWEWLGEDSFVSPNAFRYSFTSNERMYFSNVLPYTTDNFEVFYSQIKNSPGLERSVLATSERGNEIPLLRIGAPGASKHIFLTANHHAGDTSANYVVEGFTRYFAEHRDEG